MRASVQPQLAAPASDGQRSPPRIRRRPSARALFWQGLLIAAVVALFAYLVRNAEVNLAKRSLTFGFAFLGNPARGGKTEEAVTGRSKETASKAPSARPEGC